MDLKRNFLLGKMDKDSDNRLIKPGSMRDALNIRVVNSEGSDVGAIENSLGNKKLTNIDVGLNPKTIKAVADESEEKIYWLVKSDNGSYVIEWDNINKITSYVLKDTRPDEQNVLGFDENHLVTGINILVNTDDNQRFLAWCDGYNKPPRFVNIERAKTYGENNFEDKDISLIKSPPLFPPSVELIQTGSGKENHLEERFLAFSYRYKYLDGEHSACSPLSTYSFEPKKFQYDFNESTNKSMVNRGNAANITFNTGDKIVSEIDILVKESQSNTVYIVETFNKSTKGWNDNEFVSFAFFNNKIYRALPENEFFRIYDAVPLFAKAQEIIGNRLVFGNYIENYDIEDCEGNKIFPKYSLDYKSKPITGLTGTPTMRSDRDYEAVITYLDGYGRMTTGLKSEGNTIYIPIGESINANSLNLTINTKAPCFAEYYRVFVKETKSEYDIIVPTLFFNEANYTYFYIQPSEVNKVKENDFLIVKVDTSGVKEEVYKLKVLEVKDHEKGAFNNNDSESPRGFYIKVAVSDPNIVFSPNAYKFYRQDTRDRSEDSDRIHHEENPYFDIIFKGVSNLNDLTATVTYSSGEDLRYEIEINTTTGTSPDTFIWRTQSKDGAFSNWSTPKDITGANQIIDSDVTIKFGSTTGHDINDKWLLKKNAPMLIDEDNRVYSVFPFTGNIRQASNIVIDYYSKLEREDPSDTFRIDQISSKSYVNLEEWYYGEKIYDFINQLPVGQFHSDTKIWFRKIEVYGWPNQIFNEEKYEPGNPNVIPTTINVGKTHPYTAMIVESWRDSRDTSNEVYDDKSYIEVRYLENLPILETEGLELKDEIYHEVGQTYKVDNNKNHLGAPNSDDISQGVGSTFAELNLPVNNAYAWGNAFESYKIKDLLNGRPLKIDMRPTTIIDNYRRNIRLASLIFGGVYRQSTNYNGINEFNPALNSWKDMDDSYASIQKLFSRDNDLVVFQEDKIFKVLYSKDVLFDADGNGNIRESNKVLGTAIPYAGEYGISKSPESFDYSGNNLFFIDSKRGVTLRLSLNGLSVISSNGMRDWFRDYFKNNFNSKKLGAYDPYLEQYVTSIEESPIPPYLTLNCGTQIFKTSQTEPFTYLFKLNNLDGYIALNHNVSFGAISIKAVFDGVTYRSIAISGSGVWGFDRPTLSEDIVEVTIVPITDITEEVEYSITNLCPVGTPLKIVSIILNDDEDVGKTMTSRFKWGNNPEYYSETPVFKADGVTLFKTYEGVEGQGRFPLNGSNIQIEAYKDYVNGGDFNSDEKNKINYLVSSTVYSEQDIDTILSQATNLPITTQNEGGIPETNKGNFTFNRTADEILYLIWDYRTPTVPCSANINASGSVGVYELLMNVGTLKGTTGIVYDAAGVPDRFQIEYDGQIVADTKYVGDSLTGNPPGYNNLIGTHTDIPVNEYNDQTGQFEPTGATKDITVTQSDIADGSPQEPTNGGPINLTFNKTTVTPTVIKIIVTAPVDGTAWNISGICPH